MSRGCGARLTLRVHEERLLASDGVCPYNGVSVDDRFTTLDAALLHAGVDLLDTRVGSLQAVQQLLEVRREAVVCLDSVGKEGVATSLRNVEDVQEGDARRLLLVGDVGVPRHGARSGLEEGLKRLVTRTTVDEVHLRVASGRARSGMDVVTAKVAAELQRLGDGQVGEVLVAEGHDLAIGDVSRELILARVGEAADLDALDFSADGGCQVGDLG